MIALDLQIYIDPIKKDIKILRKENKELKEIIKVIIEAIEITNSISSKSYNMERFSSSWNKIKEKLK